jgi:nicotinate-nucleotide pyrophosphorylase (carboxylating)
VAAAALHVLADRNGDDASTSILISDGSRVRPGDALLEIEAPLRTLLTAERTLLNLLGQLSGVATATAAWVDALGDSGVRVRDTRKTVPGLRVLQKYAVRCGGGVNHRMGLGDAALIKDNHVAAAGSITAALEAVRTHAPGVTCEVECDTLDQVREAVAAGAQLVLLDNMSTDQMTQAVQIARPAGVMTEASGGLTLPDAPAVAATGVDYVAVGALTHSAVVLDLGLDMV